MHECLSVLQYVGIDKTEYAIQLTITRKMRVSSFIPKFVYNNIHHTYTAHKETPIYPTEVKFIEKFLEAVTHSEIVLARSLCNSP